MKRLLYTFYARFYKEKNICNVVIDIYFVFAIM